MTFLKVAELIFILTAMPTMIGQLLRRPKDGLLMTMVYGYFVEWCVFYIIAVPIIIKRGLLSNVVFACGIVYILLCFFGMVRWKLSNKERAQRTALSKAELLLLGMFLGLVAFQIYKAIFWSYEDGDDSYYLAVSLYSSVGDTMYVTDAYRGGASNMWYRYALAPFPMWIAGIAQFTGIHSTILAQTIMQPIFIGITYVIYNGIAKLIFDENREKRYMLLCLVAVFEMFSNVSTGTQGTFLLTRARQGKEALACMALPFLFYEIFILVKKQCEMSLRDYLAIICINVSAALMSTFGNVLVSILVMFLMLYEIVKKLGVKKILITASAVIPNALAVLLYWYLG